MIQRPGFQAESRRAVGGVAMTEYRIIPLRTFIGDMYLQFKDTETFVRRHGFLWLKTTEEVREVWRFVPKEGYPRVHGYWLSKSRCPTSLPHRREAEFMHCFYSLQGGLKRFKKQYPDIQKYFDYLTLEHQEYLDKEAAANNAEVQYL
jgi:hypothetical protein